MLARSRALVVGVVTGALVLTGCADDDVDLGDDSVSVGVEDADEVDLDDIERGVALLEEEDPDEVVYVATIDRQCWADAGEERSGALPQMRVDLSGEGSLVVTYDEDADELLDLELVTDPDVPTVAWDGSGVAAWDVRDGALVGEATVDGPDADGDPDHLLRFAVDWGEDVTACVDTEEPVTELAGEGSYLELPGARLDAVEVCEEVDGWTMVLEDGSVLTVTRTGEDAVELELTDAQGDVVDVELTEAADISDADADVEGTFSVGGDGTDEVAEATFRVDLDAVGNCQEG